MEDLLIEALGVLGYPVKLQGSMLPDEAYPDTFFTFWNDSTTGQGFYSNDETAITWVYSVNVYSTDPVKVNTLLLQAKTVLTGLDFTVTGAGHSVASDEPSHTGRGMEIYYRQHI